MPRSCCELKSIGSPKLLALAATLSVLMVGLPAHAQIFKNLVFTAVTVPGAIETEVTGAAISNDSGPDDVVGFYKDSGGINHGFSRDTSGKITTFDVPGSSGTRIYGIELTAVYIAGSYTDAKQVEHGFVREQANGKLRTVDVPGAAWTRAYTVDITGTVFGAYSDQEGVIHGFTVNNPFFRKGFTTIDVPDSTGTEILGSSNYGHGFSGTFVDSSGATHGFVGSRSQLSSTIDFPGAALTSITGLDNGSGTFLVGYHGASAAGPFQGFVTTGTGLYQTIDFPEAIDTRCFGVTDDDRITGRYTDSSGVVHGFFVDAQTEFGQQGSLRR